MSKQKELLDAGLKSLDHCKQDDDVSIGTMAKRFASQTNPNSQDGGITLENAYFHLSDGRRLTWHGCKGS
jgi:hypothetical protein